MCYIEGLQTFEILQPVDVQQTVYVQQPEDMLQPTYRNHLHFKQNTSVFFKWLIKHISDKWSKLK